MGLLARTREWKDPSVQSVADRHGEGRGFLRRASALRDASAHAAHLPVASLSAAGKPGLAARARAARSAHQEPPEHAGGSAKGDPPLGEKRGLLRRALAFRAAPPHSAPPPAIKKPGLANRARNFRESPGGRGE